MNLGLKILTVGVVAALALISLGTGAYFGASFEELQRDSNAFESTIAVAERHHSDSDARSLVAQEEVADWTFGLFGAAIATLFVTSLGTFLIWKQVSLTRKAVEDTALATDEMRKANLLEEGSQRPWLMISDHFTTQSTGPILYEGYPPIQNGFLINVKIKNFGRTPCIMRVIKFDFTFIELDQVYNNDIPIERFEFERQKCRPFFVPPGESITSMPFPIHDEIAAGFRDQTTRAVFYMYLEYQGLRSNTVFVTENTSMFTFAGVVEQDGRDQIRLNRLTVGEQNRLV